MQVLQGRAALDLAWGTPTCLASAASLSPSCDSSQRHSQRRLAASPSPLFAGRSPPSGLFPPVWLLTAAGLFSCPNMDTPLANAGGCRGRFPPGHAKRHATQGLGSACLLARCSARSSMQRACTKPPWAHGMGTSTWLPSDSPEESFRARQQYAHGSSASSSPLPRAS